ncbi:RNA 2',3'-cyclic phosphodiesterase [Candidatus Omnitrophota bacterium]
MNTIRTFIAVEIDPSNKQKISEVIAQLKRADSDIKWINESQMHLTLKFLGNIEKSSVQKISDIIKPIADSFNAFMIQFSQIGAFPNMRHPRVIWLGIDKGSESLKLLNKEIETGLEKNGFQKEGREYKAHLTLGRVKSLKNIQEAMRLLSEISFEPQSEIKITRLVLFQSTLTPKGAIYTPLAEFPLQLQ